MWAVKYALYKEAVDLLRRGLLLYDDGNVLLSQKSAAKAIDQYVNRKIFNLEVELENLNEAAYMGVLYYEAVTKLKNGEFDVLNNGAIADTIDDYVQSKFAKYAKTKMEIRRDDDTE